MLLVVGALIAQLSVDCHEIRFHANQNLLA